MSRRTGRIVLLSALVLVLAAPAARAQDPLTVGPDIYKLLLDNEQVRILEVTFKPGAKIGAHSHPGHAVYILTPGKLKISHPDGTSQEIDATAGQTIWIPAETHWAENIGTTELRLVVTEVKSATAPAAPTK